MSEEKRQLILYIAMSLDGYIAGEDDDIDFLSTVQTPGEDFGHAAFMEQIDTVIWGRKTFDKVLSFDIPIPYANKKVFVISRNRTGHQGHVEFHNDVPSLIHQLKQENGKNIYCDGGAEIVLELMKHRLFDKIIVSIIPVLLGAGKRLFLTGFPETGLELIDHRTYPAGLVQLWYQVAKD